MRTLPVRGGLLLAILALPACAESGAKVDPLAPEKPAQAALLAALDCTVSRGTGVKCVPQQGGEASRNLILGGQGTYVNLQATNLNISPGATTWSFDATVQNLLPQAMGTADGTTLEADGVQAFFHLGPVADVGTASVANADGTGDYTGTAQPYHKYAEILQPNQTSQAKTWVFNVSPTTTSISFKVYVRAAVPHPDGWLDLSVSADTMDSGQTQPLVATARNVVGTPLPGTVTWGTSNAAVATVNASGVVTAVGPGVATITATHGTRTISAPITVCAFTAVGGVVTFTGSAASSICLSGGGGAAEFTVISTNTATSGNLALSMNGVGTIGVSGAPSPNLLPAEMEPRFARAQSASSQRLSTDESWELRLRERERRDLSGMFSSARTSRLRSGGARRTITVGPVTEGALMNLNVSQFSCSSPDIRTARVMKVGTHAIIMADTMNPANGFTPADYEAISARFDTLVYPTVTGTFGEPADIDENGRVIILYTRAVNELTPGGSSSYVGGFFFSRDLFPQANCATSNEGEIFYMLAPDPTGAVNGNVRSLSFVRGKTIGTLGHEFQHLINSSRRLWINPATAFETVWMDEGLAHISEELLFYRQTGLTPRSNVNLNALVTTQARTDAFFEFMEPNFGRYRQFLVTPENQSPFQTDDDLATRGAIWSFLRYAADRKGGTEGDLWAALVKNGIVGGRANLVQGLGLANDAQLATWFRDWTAAVYADDAVAGVAASYQIPSWSFRSVYGGLDYNGDGFGDGLPVKVRNVVAGTPQTFTLSAGGSAYLRMGVAAGTRGAVTVTSGGGTPPVQTAVMVFRRK